jgi:hypothetical protein
VSRFLGVTFLCFAHSNSSLTSLSSLCSLYFVCLKVTHPFISFADRDICLVCFQ